MAGYYYLKQQQPITDKTINIPFGFNSSGMVDLVDSNSFRAWRNRILSVLLAGAGQRIWYDRYGADLTALAAFQTPNDVAAVLKGAVSEAFARWIPEVSLADVQYTYNPNGGYDGKSSTFTINVYYNLPDGRQDQVTVVKQAQSLTSSGDTLQVTWNG